METPKTEMRAPVDGLADELRSYCKQLKLSQAFADRILDYEGDADRVEFIRMALQKEVERRRATRIGKNTDKAGFPYRPSADEFDCSEVSFPAGTSLESLLRLPFCTGGNSGNIVMYGKTGAGKTMLSIILGAEACLNGKSVRFYNTQTLLEKLKDAQEKGRLSEFLHSFDQVDVLILDEFAYVPCGVDETRLLFRLLSRLEGRTSVIINTILEFSKWTEVLPDERLAASIAGKVMRDSTLILFHGRDRRFDAHRSGN